MSTRTLPLFLLGICLYLPALGQITLAPNDYLNPLGDAIRCIEGFPPTLPLSNLTPPSTGPNQTWDYRWIQLGVPYEDPEPMQARPGFPDGDTYDEESLSSGFAPAVPIPVYTIRELNNDNRITLGVEIPADLTGLATCGSCTGADSVRFLAGISSYETPDTSVRFPLTMGDNWTATYTQEIAARLYLPSQGLNDVPAVQTDSFAVTHEVVGWGTITLPNTTRSGFQDLEVLQLKTSTRIRSYYEVDGQAAPQALLDSLGLTQGQESQTEVWNFWAAGLERPTLTIGFDQAGNVTSYDVAAGNYALNPETEGQYFPQVLALDGLLRQGAVYLPPSYNGIEPLPLVVALHGYNSDATVLTWQSQLNAVADTAGFIVVYPQGEQVTNLNPPPGFPPQSFGWNTGGIFDSEVDDVAFIDALIDFMGQQFRIDSSRVYATGISNGGFMTSILACELSDRLAGVAMVAGGFDCGRSNAIPTAIIHGTSDPVVAYQGNGTLGLPAINVLADQLAGINGCNPTPDSLNLPDIDPNDNTTVTQFTYNSCDPDGEVVFYRVNNGSHVWDGGPPVPPLFAPLIGSNVNQDFSASEAIWQFFREQHKPDAPGFPRMLQRSITVGMLTREYLLYVPAAYDGSEDWPLVINLHGATVNAETHALVSVMQPVADTGHFLIAYPKGISNSLGDIGWNEPMLNTLQDDVAFISHLIDSVSVDFAVDADRVYACGMSNGGGMSLTLACQLTDRLAAVASVAAPGLLAACEPSRPIPVLYMHGTADLLVPFVGGQAPLVPLVFPAARDRLAFWVDSNGCTTAPVVDNLPDLDPNDGSTVIRERYTGCEDDVEVEFYEITDGGHTWPNGPAEQVPPGLAAVLGSINRDIDASTAIWRFFSRFERAAPTSIEPLAGLSLAVYPNPSQGPWTVLLELPQRAEVDLALYNAMGQQVAQLQQGPLPAGIHQVEGPYGLASGLYHLRMATSTGVVNRTVVIE